MELCSGGFEPMLDYVQNPVVHKGFVKDIANLADGYQYMSNIEDLGAGILVIDFKIPSDYRPDDIRKAFESSEELKRASTPAKRLGYNVPSIRHLGGDGCYFTVVQARPQLEDLYRLLVFSYDEASSTYFHQRICQRIDASIQKMRIMESDEQRARFLRSPIASKQIPQMDGYKWAMWYGAINRRVVAYTVLKELGITVPSETMKIKKGLVVEVVSTDVVTRDYPVVFVDDNPEMPHCVLYSHAYALRDLVYGAPWNMGESIGFRCYQKSEKTVFKPDFHIRGAPLGLPYAPPEPLDTSRPAYPKTIEVRKTVVWNTNVDVMLVADPRGRQDVIAASEALTDQYNLAGFWPVTWRTLAIYLAAPEIQNIPLNYLAHYTLADAVTVHYERFAEIVELWTSIRKHYDDTKTETQDIALPRINTVFRTPTDDSKYVLVDKRVLNSLLQLHKSLFQHGVRLPPRRAAPVARSDVSDVGPPPDDPGRRPAKRPPKGKAKAKPQRAMETRQNGTAHPRSRRPPISASETEEIAGSGDDALYTFQ